MAMYGEILQVFAEKTPVTVMVMNLMKLKKNKPNTER
jgi:hypothetical protein